MLKTMAMFKQDKGNRYRYYEIRIGLHTYKRIKLQYFVPTSQSRTNNDDPSQHGDSVNSKDSKHQSDIGAVKRYDKGTNYISHPENRRSASAHHEHWSNTATNHAYHENGSNVPTNHENGSSAPTNHENGSTAPTNHENGSNAPTKYENGSTAPTNHENGSNVPTNHENGSGAPTNHENGSNAPTNNENGGNDSCHYENGSNAPTNHENGSNAPSHLGNGSNTPTNHENGINDSSHYQNGSNAPTNHENGSNAPNHHENGKNTPTHYENGSSTPYHHENGSDAPTHHEYRNNHCDYSGSFQQKKKHLSKTYCTLIRQKTTEFNTMIDPECRSKMTFNFLDQSSIQHTQILSFNKKNRHKCPEICQTIHDIIVSKNSDKFNHLTNHKRDIISTCDGELGFQTCRYRIMNSYHSITFGVEIYKLVKLPSFTNLLEVCSISSDHSQGVGACQEQLIGCVAVSMLWIIPKLTKMSFINRMAFPYHMHHRTLTL